MHGRTDVRNLSVAFPRQGSPRVGILDNKPHIRSFLAETFEELGFVARECLSACDITAHADAGLDLVVIGVLNGEQQVRDSLYALACAAFRGKVMLFGGRGSEALIALHEAGEELGLSMLPPLRTPFGQRNLVENLSVFLPIRSPSKVPVDIQEALRRQWFELRYEPKIDPHSMRLHGAEALVQLRHPDWGTVPLERVVPNEGDAHMRVLTEFVVSSAMKDWIYFAESDYPVEISVDLPVSLLADPDFIEFVFEQLPDHQAFPDFMVEINGPEAIHDLALMQDIAKQLKRQRVGMVIDAVGVDAPSLTAAADIPFIEIKVDRAFVQDCSKDQGKHRTCEMINDIAKRCGMRAVAAGVEAYQDFAAVRDLGFDLVQGELIAKPVQAPKFLRSVLAAGRAGSR